MCDLPKHVAIIMDGNGRWAENRNLPRINGHKKGADAVDDVVASALDFNIPYLTLYAFSLENWKRPKAEVQFLMDFLLSYLESKRKTFVDNEISFRIIGRMNMLNDKLINKINDIVAETSSYSKLVLTLALSYAGRAEIVDSTKLIVKEVLDGKISLDDIDEKCFSSHLYSSNLPDPDLMIRTSGELRISNFLLWQLSYSELYFTKRMWPDFKREDFAEALEVYKTRQRRYGKL